MGKGKVEKWTATDIPPAGLAPDFFKPPDTFGA